MSLDSCLCSSASARPLLRLTMLFFPLFCLCLQGWPMNRQLRKGPSFSSALLPVDGIHLNIQPMAAAGGGGVVLSPAWVHVHSCNSCHHQLSPRVSFFFSAALCEAVRLQCVWDWACILSSFIFGLASWFFFFFLLSSFVFNKPEKPKMMYLKHKEQYWFGVKVMWGPV